MTDLDDPRLDDLTDGARLLHYALAATASARGRFPGTARGLARHLRLTAVATVGRQLVELVDAGVVRLYEAEVDGTRVTVGELVVGRRPIAPSRLAELGADRYPDPVEERESRRPELRTTGARPEADRPVDLRPSSGEREHSSTQGDSSLSPRAPAAARTRGRARRGPAREQLQLGAPVETCVEVPEAIRAAVETWEAHADALRAAGVSVPAVARADLVALAEGVDPEVFGEAVRHHVGSEPCYWGSPLVLLAKRLEWQAARLVRAGPAPQVSPAPRGDAPATVATESPARPPPLVTVPDEDWTADWAQALARLRGVVELWDHAQWLAPLDGRGVTLDGEPVLVAPDASHAEWVEQEFGDVIEAALGYRPRAVAHEYTASGEGACVRSGGRSEQVVEPPVWAAADMPASRRRKPGKGGAAASPGLASAAWIG